MILKFSQFAKFVKSSYEAEIFEGGDDAGLFGA